MLREPVAVDLWAPAALPATVREKGAVAAPGGFVVYLGDRAAEGGLWRFLRAMESVWTDRPGVQAWILGHDESVLKRPEAEALPAANLRFLGSVPPAVLAAFFTEAAAVVCSSGPGSVPPLALRVLAAGGLLIGPDTAAFREVVRHRQNGLLVEPAGWGDLASELSRALAHPAEAEVFRAAGRRQILDWHSAAAVAAAFGRLAAECAPDYPDAFGGGEGRG